MRSIKFESDIDKTYKSPWRLIDYAVTEYGDIVREIKAKELLEKLGADNERN